MFKVEYMFLTKKIYTSLLQGYLSDYHNVPLVLEQLIPALIVLIEGTLLLCFKVDSDLGLGDATYRILSCLITLRFPTRLYPIKFIRQNILLFFLGQIYSDIHPWSFFMTKYIWRFIFPMSIVMNIFGCSFVQKKSYSSHTVTCPWSPPALPPHSQWPHQTACVPWPLGHPGACPAHRWPLYREIGVSRQ
jgi:hypothetical protein